MFQKMRLKKLWNFEIQTDHQISPRRPDVVIFKKKKKTCRIIEFVVLAAYKIKIKENKKGDKYLDLAKGLKNVMKREGDDDIYCN